jgi:hypothetical protein
MCGVTVREYRSLILRRVEAGLGGVEGDTQHLARRAVPTWPSGSASRRRHTGRAGQQGTDRCVHGGLDGSSTST